MKCVYKPNIDKNLIPVHIPNEKIISSVLSEKSRQICKGGRTTYEEMRIISEQRKEAVNANPTLLVNRWNELKEQILDYIRDTPMSTYEQRRLYWVFDKMKELEEL